MEEQANISDEIDLLAQVGVLMSSKRLIIGITIGCMLVSVVLSILSLMLPPDKSFLPNKYTPKALMLINDSSSSGGALSSMLSSSGLGSLASLAGVNVGGGSTYSALAVYLVETNDFLDSVVDRFDLVKRYKIKKSVKTESRKTLMNNLIVSYDEDSSVLSIAFTDYDPSFAQSVVNYCVDYYEARFKALGLDKNAIQKENLEKSMDNSYAEIRLLEENAKQLERTVSSGNSSGLPSIMLETSKLKKEIEAQEQVYGQLKIQYELLKVTMASETPIFQVLERAEVPDKKSEPSRATLCMIITVVGFFFSVMLVFFIEAIKKVRNDPEAMRKISGKL